MGSDIFWLFSIIKRSKNALGSRFFSPFFSGGQKIFGNFPGKTKPLEKGGWRGAGTELVDEYSELSPKRSSSDTPCIRTWAFWAYTSNVYVYINWWIRVLFSRFLRFLLEICNAFSSREQISNWNHWNRLERTRNRMLKSRPYQSLDFEIYNSD